MVANSRLEISLVICTYNPDITRLQKVINAVHDQVGVEKSKLELVLVDNRSNPTIDADRLDFGHLSYKLILEREPGLTAARITGFNNSLAPLIIFVDDDNCLDQSYCQVSIHLSKMYSAIGVFSSGSIDPEYEIDPPENIDIYWPYLALHKLTKDKWANWASSGVLPIGAGMVVRRCVMEEYIELLRQQPIRRKIDRDGLRLFAGGDTDIGNAAIHLGLGCGYFVDLKLTHIILSERLNLEYLGRLVHDVSYSRMLVGVREGTIRIDSNLILKQLVKAFYANLFLRGARQRARRVSSFARLKVIYKQFIT